jgi:predicted small secreted protein
VKVLCATEQTRRRVRSNLTLPSVCGNPAPSFGNGKSTEIKMKAIIAMTVAGFFLFLGGCNTMEGAGKDVKAGGQKVETEAAEHKKY